MTLSEAKSLRVGTTLHHDTATQASGKEPLRVRTSGKPQTWVRSPDRVLIPVKWGLYKSFKLDEHDIAHWRIA